MLQNNLKIWKDIQEKDYFHSNPSYSGLHTAGDEVLQAINYFTELHSTYNVIVIGCGYGRETLYIAPCVKTVYGIEVSEKLLHTAVKFVNSRGVKNFIPVLVDTWKQDIPQNIDFVFSEIVLQHITDDIVIDYLCELGKRLKPQGEMVIQFCENFHRPKRIFIYEPHFSRSVEEITSLVTQAELDITQIKTITVTPKVSWHWIYIRK